MPMTGFEPVYAYTRVGGFGHPGAGTGRPVADATRDTRGTAARPAKLGQTWRADQNASRRGNAMSAMDGDHTRWAHPIRAQRLVEELEEQLGTDAEDLAADNEE